MAMAEGSHRTAALSPLPQGVLSAARSWLEDAEVQIHNCQSVLQRAEAMATDDRGVTETLTELRHDVEALAEQVRRAVQSIEAARKTRVHASAAHWKTSVP
jgi:hypothetical protein